MITKGKIQPVLQLWIPVFQWEFKGRWGGGDDFSMLGCILAMEPVARVWSCPLFPKTPPKGESTAFWKGIIQSLLPFVCGGQGGYQPACSTCGQRGNREPYCHLFPTDLSPNRSQVAHSPHLPTRFEPHTHTAKGSDACYQSNITNVVLSDGVHCISIIAW